MTQFDAMVRQIRNFLPQSDSVNEAASKAREHLRQLLGELTDEQLEMIEAAAAELQRSYEDVEILHKHSLLEPHKKWYPGSRPGDRHWPALHEYIAVSKGWGREVADNIGTAADEVVSLLADPQKNQFQYRGLVVGHVQSGKTANMTGVVAKAVDAGYNMVVILAGLTNKLRQQTQRRFEADLLKREPLDWVRWTNTEGSGDFRMPAGRVFLPPQDTVQFCVLKKNVSPLRQFLSTLERTPAVTSRSLKVLLIDDECDSASVNAASGEFDVTAINSLIRKILSRFQAVSYVGYTATPFANVLINPYPDDNQHLDDLYPKDFITALERPKGYFGTEELFGREPIDADELGVDEEGLDMIREVPEEELPDLQPPSRKDKDSFYPQMTGSLENSVLYFIASCGARLCRGHTESHMTMLVHTSVYTVLHERLSEQINAWLTLHSSDLRAGKGAVTERIRKLWENEQGRVPDTITTEPWVRFGDLSEHIGEVLDRLEMPVENGFSENRIDYENGPRIYIVVGGTVLARGLTLEGLMVSYFVRSTSQYDTLLQMGRWFGYRHGYEDIPRIWMTDELRLAFREMALVEAEVRSDILEYAERKVTPMAFAVRIRSIPGMAITAAGKMRHAERCSVSYAGQHRQTIWFDHRSPTVVERNWRAAAELLSGAERSGLRSSVPDRVLYEGVPVNHVRRFLRDYEVHEKHADLSGELLLKYIDGVQSSLEFWNVGLYEPGRSGSAISDKSLGLIENPKLTNRARIDYGDDRPADVKALMSRRDIAFDCLERPGTDVTNDWRDVKAWRKERVGHIPLLLLYAIDRDSEPKRDSKTRCTLNAIDHLIGFGIVFPGNEDGAGGYVSVRLDPPSGDELELLDEEVQQRLEAGDAV